MTGPNVQSNSRRVPVFSVDSVTALLKRRRSINEHSLFRHQSTIQPPFNFATLIKSKTVKKKKKKIKSHERSPTITALCSLSFSNS